MRRQAARRRPTSMSDGPSRPPGAGYCESGRIMAHRSAMRKGLLRPRPEPAALLRARVRPRPGPPPRSGPRPRRAPGSAGRFSDAKPITCCLTASYWLGCPALAERRASSGPAARLRGDDLEPVVEVRLGDRCPRRGRRRRRHRVHAAGGRRGWRRATRAAAHRQEDRADRRPGGRLESSTGVSGLGRARFSEAARSRVPGARGNYSDGSCRRLQFRAEEVPMRSGRGRYLCSFARSSASATRTTAAKRSSAPLGTRTRRVRFSDSYTAPSTSSRSARAWPESSSIGDTVRRPWRNSTVRAPARPSLMRASCRRTRFSTGSGTGPKRSSSSSTIAPRSAGSRAAGDPPMHVDLRDLVRDVAARDVRVHGHVEPHRLPARARRPPSAGRSRLHRLLQHLHVQLEADRRDVPGLLGAEQVAGAADLQVAHRDLEPRAELGVVGERREPRAPPRR